MNPGRWHFTYENLRNEDGSPAIFFAIMFFLLGLAANAYFNFVSHEWAYFATIILLIICLISATLFIFNQHYLIRYLKDKNEEFIGKYFNKFLRSNTEALKVTLDKTQVYYPKLEKAISDDNDEESERFGNLLFDCWKDYFESTCNNLRNSIEYYLSTNGVEVDVSICIKQLRKPFWNTPSDSGEDILEVYEGDLDELIAYAIHRDSESKTVRELGTEYTVLGNSTFRKCISSGRADAAFFKGKELKEKYDNGDYDSENPNFYEYYTCATCVPIYIPVGSKTIYYGFLAADCHEKHGSGEAITDIEVIHIMKPFANLLAIMYHDSTLYFDNLISHIISSSKNNR